MQVTDRELYIIEKVLEEYWSMKTGSNVIDTHSMKNINEISVQERLEIVAKVIPKRKEIEILGYGI